MKKTVSFLIILVMLLTACYSAFGFADYTKAPIFMSISRVFSADCLFSLSTGPYRDIMNHLFLFKESFLWKNR